MRFLALLIAALAIAVGTSISGQTRSHQVSVIRINELGYPVGASKVAYVLSPRPARRTAYAVLEEATRRTVLHGTGRGSCPSWSTRWRGCARIDFSALRSPGVYRIAAGAALSPPFAVGTGASLYGPPAERSVAFLQAQRDGADVIPGALGRRPSHLADATARFYAAPRYHSGALAGPVKPAGPRIDMAGGWFDAGDYLKFTGTSSFTDVMLLFVLREYGPQLPDQAALLREARFGTDWLLKTWDQSRRVLVEQVGLGDGNNGSILGDHDVWRLPQADDSARGGDERLLAHRPVFAANRSGRPVSPNLAGREAAAFALCAQVFRATDPTYADRCLRAGETLYAAAARRWSGPLAGSVPSDYYHEPVWRDDMELAATELYLATAIPARPGIAKTERALYLEPASSWADAYMSGSLAGEDWLGLYDVAGLAHYDLYRAMVASGHTTDLYTNASDLLRDMHDQLALGARLAARDPFGLTDVAAPSDTVAHALGYAVQARLYAAVSGNRRFEPLAQQQLAWILGANPWGSSFVIGTGSVFPRCPSHQIANLSGSLNGQGALLEGAVVAGPGSTSAVDGELGAPDGYRPCSADRAFAGFNGRGFTYRDNVRSPVTSEPTDDLVALSLAAFAQETGGLGRAVPLVVSR